MFAKLLWGKRDMKNGAKEKLFDRPGASRWPEGEPPRAPAASNDQIGEYEALLSCWESIDGRSRVILSRDGKLVASSDGARRLSLQNECLSCATMLSQAGSGLSDSQRKKILGAKVGAVETVILPKPAGEGHYLISATGVSADVLALAIRDAHDDFAAVFADLEEAFGLTRCEVLVVERLLHGHGAQSIADDLGISVHTVRAHLRHCYDKLGVSSRESLWQRLAPYRLN